MVTSSGSTGCTYLLLRTDPLQFEPQQFCDLQLLLVELLHLVRHLGRKHELFSEEVALVPYSL